MCLILKRRVPSGNLVTISIFLPLINVDGLPDRISFAPDSLISLNSSFQSNTIVIFINIL